MNIVYKNWYKNVRMIVLIIAVIVGVAHTVNFGAGATTVGDLSAIILISSLAFSGLMLTIFEPILFKGD